MFSATYRRSVETRTLGWPLIVACLAGGLLVDAHSSQAQGPLRRLGDRIRSRIDPLAQPPVAPVRPVPPVAGSGPVAPYNTPPQNAPGQNAPRSGAAGLRPLQPTDSRKVADPNRDADSPSLASPPAQPSLAENRPTIGIEVAEHRDGFRGVRVVQFQSMSRAEAAGLRTGDVIVGVEGQTVSSIADVASIISAANVGDNVRLRIVPADVLAAAAAGRGSISVRDLTIPLIARRSTSPNSDANARVKFQREPESLDAPRGDARLGVEVANSRSQQGAVVTRVIPRSPSQVAKMQPGDRIVSINGKVVREANNVIRAVSDSKPGDRLRVQWVRNDQLREATVTLAGPDGLASPTEIAALSSRDNDTRSDSLGGEAKSNSESLMSGLGTALGGFFGGQKANSAVDPDRVETRRPAEMPNSNASDTFDPIGELAGPSILSQPEDQDVNGKLPLDVSRELPGPGSVVQSEEMPAPTPMADPLALGDDEPVQRAGFTDAEDQQTDAVLPIPNQLPAPIADPPSLDRLQLPPPNVRPNSSTTEQTIERLRAEIERLRDRVRQLETSESVE